ncbi:hypothetical protein PILCRDRAFT_328654 [Piloderma croceum F 1598]|uniref:Uncharacterized protein n=1 Tax=Piloderma croceum (strain F 1598) TaxID=765440 RepID=A0A0C3G5H7_PILCF|nr:hypothetical protein PILCRDRAFT_328654 [Piloderma croceum F 1598]
MLDTAHSRAVFPGAPRPPLFYPRAILVYQDANNRCSLLRCGWEWVLGTMGPFSRISATLLYICALLTFPSSPRRIARLSIPKVHIHRHPFEILPLPIWLESDDIGVGAGCCS